MALLPRATATLSLSRSSAPYLLLAAAYAALLAASWQTDTLALMMPGSLAEGLSGGGGGWQQEQAAAAASTACDTPAVASSSIFLNARAASLMLCVERVPGHRPSAASTANPASYTGSCPCFHYPCLPGHGLPPTASRLMSCTGDCRALLTNQAPHGAHACLLLPRVQAAVLPPPW
jgi:hypothetical protein